MQWEIRKHSCFLPSKAWVEECLSGRSYCVVPLLGVDERFPHSDERETVLIVLVIVVELDLHRFPSDPVLAYGLTSQDTGAFEV
jgi:hypothetical protein